MLAAHLGRKVAPYVWRAVTVAAVVLACLGLALVVTLAGAVTRGSHERDEHVSVCGRGGSSVLAASADGATSGLTVDGGGVGRRALANAGVIAATGRQLGIPDLGVVVALATAAPGIPAAQPRPRGCGFGRAVPATPLPRVGPSHGFVAPGLRGEEVFRGAEAGPRLAGAARDAGGAGCATLRVPIGIRPVGDPRRSAGPAYRGFGTQRVPSWRRPGHCSPTRPGWWGCLRANPRTVEEDIGWPGSRAAPGSGSRPPPGLGVGIGGVWRSWRRRTAGRCPAPRTRSTSTRW